MAPDESTLMLRARRAYEWGRAWHGLRSALLLLPLLACSLLGCHRPAVSVAIGLTLLAVVATMRWVGGELGRAVMPGVVAGLAPMSFPLLGRLVHQTCSTGPCSFFVGACTLGGALCGAWVGARSFKAGRPELKALSTMLLLAALTGALGCVAAGVGGVIGMMAGMMVGVTPGIFAARRAE